MQLRFCARGTALVSLPGERRVVGQHPRYVGRTLTIVDGAATWPANDQPHECDSASQHGARLTKRCTAGDLWPADEQTASHCGVAFVAIDHVGGAWLPAAAPKSAAAPARGTPTKPKD